MTNSLSATYLRNRIIGALRTSSDTTAQAAATHVSQDFVFLNPSLHKLAAAVVRLVHPDSSNSVATDGTHGTAFVEQMITKYSDALPRFRRASQVTEGDIVVLLTGTTGNLGAHILATLLSEKRVKKVYAFNRPSAKLDRQRLAFMEGGLPLQLLTLEALHPLEGDTSRADLGLDRDTFLEVRMSFSILFSSD